jgi:hypothetical protein
MEISKWNHSFHQDLEEIKEVKEDKEAKEVREAKEVLASQEVRTMMMTTCSVDGES